MKLRNKLQRKPDDKQEQVPADAGPAQSADELTAMSVELKRLVLLISALPDQASIPEMREVLAQAAPFDPRLVSHVLRVKELEGNWIAMYELLEKKAVHLPPVYEVIHDRLAKHRLRRWERNGS